MVATPWEPRGGDRTLDFGSAQRVSELHQNASEKVPICISSGASPSAIVSDMEAYQNGRGRADVFVPI